MQSAMGAPVLNGALGLVAMKRECRALGQHRSCHRASETSAFYGSQAGRRSSRQNRAAATRRSMPEALFQAYLRKKAASNGLATYPDSSPADSSSRLSLAVLLEETHESLSSQEFEKLSSCPHCRFPCHLSGVPACSPCEYLQAWREEAHLKPPGHDSMQQLSLPGGVDVAVVSAGGRLHTWKPDNQDSFLMQPLALPGTVPAMAGQAATAAWTSSCAAAAEAQIPGGHVSMPGVLPSASLLGHSAAMQAGLEVPALALGVFDGHGRLGKHASSYVRDVIQSSLLAQQRALLAGDPDSVGSAGAASPQALLSLALAQGFEAAAQAMERSNRDFSKSGSTAVVCGVTPDAVTAMWTGDSRAVLGICSSGRASTIALPLTDDHKPGRPDERARILAAGGRVDRSATDHLGNAVGPFRVFLPSARVPGLALSRAFGDFIVAPVGVVPTPDTTTLEFSAAAAAAASTTAALASGSGGPLGSLGSLDGGDAVSPLGSNAWDDPISAGGDRHVLIVASDGLWEWVPNAAAVRIASSFERAEDAAHALVEAAQKHWAVRYAGRNCDDITVAVAFLPADPAPKGAAA